MDATKRHDWGLIVAGILLIICSFVFFFWPGLTLVSLAAIASTSLHTSVCEKLRVCLLGL